MTIQREYAEKAYQAACMTADDIGNIAKYAKNTLVATVALDLLRKQQEISAMLYQIRESRVIDV